jgi:hypothetical protein
VGPAPLGPATLLYTQNCLAAPSEVTGWKNNVRKLGGGGGGGGQRDSQGKKADESRRQVKRGL